MQLLYFGRNEREGNNEVSTTVLKLKMRKAIKTFRI